MDILYTNAFNVLSTKKSKFLLAYWQIITENIFCKLPSSMMDTSFPVKVILLGKIATVTESKTGLVHPAGQIVLFWGQGKQALMLWITLS